MIFWCWALQDLECTKLLCAACYHCVMSLESWLMRRSRVLPHLWPRLKGARLPDVSLPKGLPQWKPFYTVSGTAVSPTALAQLELSRTGTSLDHCTFSYAWDNQLPCLTWYWNSSMMSNNHWLGSSKSRGLSRTAHEHKYIRMISNTIEHRDKDTTEDDI